MTRQEILAAIAPLARKHGMTRLSLETEISRVALYRMLALTGNPTLRNFLTVTSALGFELVVAPCK